MIVIVPVREDEDDKDNKDNRDNKDNQDDKDNGAIFAPVFCPTESCWS